MTRRLAFDGLAFLATLTVIFRSGHAADCSIAVNSSDIPINQPVLLTPSNSQEYSSFLKPNNQGLLKVSEGQRVTVACPGTSFLILNGNATSVEASCVDQTLFQVEGGSRYTFNALACSTTVTPTLRFTGASCGARNSFSIAEVGFVVGTDFYRLYDVCFSNRTLSAAYAHHTITAGIEGKQELPDTISWVYSSVFGKVDVEVAYNLQNLTLDKLGVNTSAYLTDEMYLECGALAPAEDFLLEPHQAAAFFGVNSAPRWSKVGSGNWKNLEETLRKAAIDNSKDLDVYTGTHGVLALPNSDEVNIQIYLDETGSGKKVLPVPRYLWKVVHEPLSGVGAAFITVNNPFINETEAEEYMLCTDICKEIKWLKWEHSDLAAGKSYCCKYSEFKKRVPNAPTIEIKYHTPTNSSQAAASSVWLLFILAFVAAISSNFAGI